MSGHMERVRTNAGWHLRIVGGNGETVVDGEVLNNAASVQTAAQSVVNTVLALTEQATEFSTIANRLPVVLADVDERTPEQEIDQS